jgi:HEAT repeat protein
MTISPQLVYELMFVVASALAALGILTTCVNLRRSWHDRRAATRLPALRTQLLAALDGDESPLVGSTRREDATFTALVRSLLPTVRGADRERLSQILEVTGVVNAALLDLHSRSGVRRARAADLLGLASINRAVPELVDLLRDRDVDVRRTAARALGLIGDAAAVPALLATIDDARNVPLNTTTMALLRVGPEALEPLIEGLRVGSTKVRAVCAEILGLRGSVAALPALTAAIHPWEPLEVRIRAARALGRVGVPGSVDAVAALLNSQEPAPLRAVATRALGQIGGRRTVTLLRDALDAPEHVVAMNAARALASSGDDGADILIRFGRELTSRRGAYAREGLSYIAVQATHAARL